MLITHCTSLLVILGGVMTQSPRISGDVIQAFLNDYCRKNSAIQGCKRLTATNTVAVPGSNGCPSSHKRCDSLPDACVPINNDCDEFGPDQGSRFPSRTRPCADLASPFYMSDIIFCSIGPKTANCHNDALQRYHNSEYFVQCANSRTQGPVSVDSLAQYSWRTRTGGAGIYRCRDGAWVAEAHGPSLSALEKSCVSFGCGQINTPSAEVPQDRPWAFVRKVIISTIEGPLQCLATFITPTVAVTAAHCLLRFQDGQLQVRDRAVVVVEAPVTMIGGFWTGNFTPAYMAVHPESLRGTDGYDVGLLFLTPSDTQWPFACLFDGEENAIGSHGMAFALTESIVHPEPVFTLSLFCQDMRPSFWFDCSLPPLQVSGNKFCGQPEEELPRGSSGGPFLYRHQESGSWILLGIFVESREVRGTSMANCRSNKHHIFNRIDKGIYKWILREIVNSRR